MFFDEPLAAFGAIRASLVPGGRLVFACWQGVEHNPWHVGTALRSLLPSRPAPPPGKSPVGPFVLGDDEYAPRPARGSGVHRRREHAARDDRCGPRPTPWSTAPCSRSWAIPAEREEEAMAMVDRHLDRFAVGPRRVRVPAGVHGLRGRQPLSRGRLQRHAAPQEARDHRGLDAGAHRARPAASSTACPTGVTVKRQARGSADVVVAFFTERREFERRIGALSRMIFPSGGLWVAWPKRASGLETTMHEGVVREVALPLGPGRQQGVRHRRDLDGAARRVAARARAPDQKKANRDRGQMRTSTLPTMVDSGTGPQ